ncbi:MAG: MFS transporter [Asticcacaulis sp.]|uniref:MFS transporter n=1 Tax=Asticcacaulis sp. TaxID=1872648 RepID=UPI0039E66371
MNTPATGAPEGGAAEFDPDDNRHPLQIPNFRLLWLARMAAVLGGTAQGAAIAWEVYTLARRHSDVNESAFYLGMFGLSQFIALFCLTIPAGIIVDRVARKNVMFVVLLLQSILSLVFCAYSLLPDAPIWGLFVLGFIQGALRAFIAPATSALGPMLVPRQALPKAIAMNSMSMQVGSIVGPALGGVLIAISTQAAYVVCTVMLVLATGLIFAIKADTRPAAPTGSKTEMVKEGADFIWKSKLLLGAMSLDLAAVLLGGATALIPVFSRDVLHVSPFYFGLLQAATPAGAILMSMSLSQFPIRRNAGPWMYSCVAIFGVATIVFGLSRNVWLSILALVVLGAADMVSVFVRQTLVQIVTPDHMRGRVSSASFLFIGASNQLGEFESGTVARFIGPVGAALFGGIGSLLVTLIWIKLFPVLWKADRLE